MRDFKYYEALLVEIKKLMEEEGVDFHDLIEMFQYNSFVREVEVLGAPVTLYKETMDFGEHEIARLDDPIQFSYLRLKDDKYIIFEEGYYDSWNGGEFDGEVNVGTLEKHTIIYPAIAEE